MDTYAESRQEFLIKTDADGDGEYKEIAQQPWLEIRARDAVQCSVVVPTFVDEGEVFPVNVAFLDSDNNWNREYTGTIHLKTEPESGDSISAAIQEEDDGHEVFEVSIRDPGRYRFLVETDDGLKGIKSGQTQLEGGELRLRSCLTRVATDLDQENEINRADWILIDCPPSLDRLTMNALAASDYVLVPVDPGAGGRGALGDTMEYIYSAQKWYNPTLRVIGLLVNNTDPRTIYDQTTEDVVRDLYGDLVFETVITASVRIRESTEEQTPLVFCGGSEYVRYADLYRALKNEVIDRAR